MKNLQIVRPGLLAALLLGLTAIPAPAVDATAEPETIAGTRMRVDWPRLISENNLELPKLPTSHGESLRLGNGDIGVAVYAVPECLVLFVGKNDLLDYRTKPLAHSPEATAFTNVAVPMPTTKPAGWIRFREATPRNPDATARLDIWNAEVSTRVASRETPELRAFVAKNRNLIATEYQPTSGGDFDIELARHKDTTGVIPTAPEFGAEGRDVWVRYQFPADPDTYPNGFEYVMLGRVIGGEVVKAEVIGESAKPASLGGGVEGVARLRMKSSGPVTFLTAVFTTRDDKNPLQAARAAMDAAERAGLPELRREQAQAWQDFWQHSFVQLEGRNFLNQQWLLSLYHLASVTKPGSVGPGLFGPWAPEDFPPWGNDRHWDYNVQAALWGTFSCNHLELTKAYNDEIFDLLPCAQMMVRDYYGNIGGAKFPGVGWPRKYTAPVSSRKSEFTSPWVNGFDAQPLWWYYQYSQDKTFLREKGYPVIKACAEFYEKFVQPAPDGKYDMPPTAVWDLSFMVPDAKNSTIDLAFAKMLLRTAVAASEVLGVDEDRRANWEHVAANLRGYGTTVIDGKAFKPVNHISSNAIPHYTTRDFPSGEVLVAYENYPVIQYNLSPWTMPIFPAGEFGLHSPQKDRELALRTVQITPYYLWDDLVMLSMASVRLGQDPLDVFEKHTRAIRHENGCQTYPKSSGMSHLIFMHFLGWPVVVNESLVQSYTGQIRVAPVKLKNTARFARLRTEGAFLLSGEIQSGGKVSYLAITSEAGVPCNLVRPWDGAVRVRRLDSMEAVTATEKDGVLTFPTDAGATYVVDRPDAPWEAQPITDIPSAPRPALSHSAVSEGSISFYGIAINQPRWCSTKFPKTITLAAGGTATVKDGFFGSLGWTLPTVLNEGELPAFVGLLDIKDPATKTWQSPTYSDDLDDPTAVPSPEVDRIPENFKSIAYQYPGEGAEATLYSIPLTGTIPPAFLVGIAFGNLAHPQEDAYGTASFRASLNDGPGTEQLPAIANDGLVDWIFFRVENAVAGDTIHIHGTGGPNGMASIALITFDPVP